MLSRDVILECGSIYKVTPHDTYGCGLAVVAPQISVWYSITRDTKSKKDGSRSEVRVNDNTDNKIPLDKSTAQLETYTLSQKARA